MTDRSRKNINQSALTFAVIVTETMGNTTPLAVIPANTARRELIITNISDTTGYFSIGDEANLTVTNYTLSLTAGETYIFTDLISTQAIYAVCGAAGKDIAYQEAT